MHVRVLRPTSVEEAVSQLQNDTSAVLIGGGTALINNMRSGRQSCGTWVSIDKLGLDQISCQKDGLHIGTAVTMTQIVQSPFLKQVPYNLLREAICNVASWQIRNVATLGGCIASGIPGTDPLCALFALDAEIEWYDAHGAHRMPLENLANREKQEMLMREGVLTQIILPQPAADEYLCRFRRAAVRKAFSWPLVNFAALFQISAGNVRYCRIAVGGMARGTMLLSRTMETMAGRRLANLCFEEIAAAYASEVHPVDSLQGSAAYKRLVCRNYLLEIFEALTDREADDDTEYDRQ